MKEKKETNVAKNVSSGAEKVEAIEKSVKTQDGQAVEKKTVRKESSKRGQATEEKIDVKKMNAQSTNGKAEKESEAAKARVAAALKKQEEKERRAEAKAKARKAKAEERARRAKMTAEERKAEAQKRKAERKAAREKMIAEEVAKLEKRAAERKAKAEKHAAERKKIIEQRKAEREAKIRERAHAKANRSQAKSKARAKRSENRGEKREKRSYGGWLAAVVALGAVTLGLTTAVTIGAIDMKNTKDAMMMGHKSTTYEFVGIMEHVDDDLDRARVSASPVQQGRILTDLLVQARLAELDLEKMPIAMEADENITRFINRVGAECERMLGKLRRGESLSEQDQKTLESLYKTNHEIRMKLNEYVSQMTDMDITDYIKKGAGALASTLEGLEKLTLEENRAALESMKPKMKGAGMELNGMPDASEENGSPALDPAKAEEICKRYFADYKIDEFQCIGETVARGYKAYNVQGYDDNGTLLFAEVDYKNGELIRFDYFETCEGETFDMYNAKMIAEKFLQKLGYEDMEVVRVRENGTDVDFSYAYEVDGVVFYPDTVRIKVCRARGVVTGMDASKFLKNHEKRTDPSISLTLANAQAKLHKGVAVEASRLAVVETARGERAAYEFLCSYQDERYFIFIDANTGDEISIVNVKNVG